MKPLLLALALCAMPLGMGTALAESPPDALYRVTGIAQGSALNLRRGPATSHPIVGKLAADRAGLRLLGCNDTGRWCEIDAGTDGKGWASGRFLTGPPSPRVKPDRAPAPRPKPSLVSTPPLTKPLVSPAPRAKPDPSGPPEWRAMFPADKPYRVTGIRQGSTLNVRSGPGTGNGVVATLAAGESGLTILDCTDTASWCEVSAGRGPLGWVSARYLDTGRQVKASSARMVQKPRQTEAARLAATTGLSIKPGETTSIPKLPPYLLGLWDADATACKREDSATRVMVQANGLRVGDSYARFKNAIFRDEGYDLIAVLMEAQDLPTSIPQRALYRLEPIGTTLAISGDVLAERILRRCPR